MSGIANTELASQQALRILNAVAARLRVVRTGPRHVQPGESLLAQLVPASLDLDVSDLADLAFDAAGIAKDMFLANKDPFPVPPAESLADSGDFAGSEVVRDVPTQFAGGKPFVQPPLVSTVAPITSGPVPGLLGQLFGTVKLPDLRVSLEVKWILADADGYPLEEGSDFVALDGLSSPSVALVVAPSLAEYRHDTLLKPGGTQYCLWLSVTLKLGAAQVATMIGPLPFVQLPLLVPTVVGLFSEDNFAVTSSSAALLVVPAHSPFVSLEPLLKMLETLDRSLDKLRGIGKLAGFLLGIGNVLGAIPQTPRLRLTATNRIDHLGAYVIKPRPWYDFLGSDDTFDDRVNSLFVLGAPGTRVHFFNDEKCELTAQGGFTIALNTVATLDGDLPDAFVAVPSFYVSNDAAPPTMPPGRSSLDRADTTGDGNQWDTDLTSLRFADTFINTVGGELAAKRPPFPDLPCTPLSDPKPPEPLPPRGRSGSGRRPPKPKPKPGSPRRLKRS